MRHLFIFFLVISSLYANHIKWLGNYDKALQQARDKHKILMVLLIKNSSQKCKETVKNIFTNQPYIDELNQKTVAVIVNISNKHSFPIELYWSREYPTLFLVDSSSEVFIHKPLENITKEDIQDILAKIKQNKI